jgi:uncharacterized protein YlxW (UPF0749 family)
VNAQQRLWALLTDILPADELADLKRQYAADQARDQRRSKYRAWLRREQQALANLAAYDVGDYPDTVRRNQAELQRAQAWLQEHIQWAESE